MIRGRRRAVLLLAAGGLVAIAGPGCRGPLGQPRSLGRPAPFRLSLVADTGDGQRRASQQFVLDALEEDAFGAPGRARELYRRSLQVDPGNPYAYLALARHHAEWGEPRRVLGYLDQASTLGSSDPSWSPRVDAHVAGLRGAALRALGREREGRALLERARRDAPLVWDDGFLSARELR